MDHAKIEDGRVLLDHTGLPIEVTANLRMVRLNDPDAIKRVLVPGAVALLLIESAMTKAGFLLLDPGVPRRVARIDRRHGTLPAVDGTHMLVAATAGRVQRGAQTHTLKVFE